ncbi:uncharacterized protein M6B38_109165 [Iris pallida]|uniref:Reverse transcriptase domain-containing protein n=1 Tax=Iris pallida TaxID=29817 RepID=A0AAX6EGN6_IRIPA|nr:uncharacterized protein M6B38_109165 [Iris pallida]
MLRACTLDFGGVWDDHLHLVEFSYNNSYHDSIKMAPFEALYGRKCRSPISWTDVGERQLLGPELVTQIVDIVKAVRSHLQAAQDRQKMWADKHRRILEFQPGDHVFLKISPTKGTIRFGTRGKLSPRYWAVRHTGESWKSIISTRFTTNIRRSSQRVPCFPATKICTRSRPQT